MREHPDDTFDPLFYNEANNIKLLEKKYLDFVGSKLKEII